MSKVVLLVDDGPQIRRDLGMRLNKNGYVVHKTDSIEEARKLILSETIDYGIIDLKLDFRSDYGGIEVVRALKRHQPESKTLVLSGWGRNEMDLANDVASDIDFFVSKKGDRNYILEVLDALRSMEKEERRKDCFVIMPFSSTGSCTTDEWTEIFLEIIKPAVEGSGFGFTCRRSEAIQGSVIEEILDSLNKADMVIADLTDKNPNVFYELGVRHTLRDSTLLIAQKLDDIPFDLRHYAIQVYQWKTKKTREESKTLLKEVISKIVAEPTKGASPVRKYLRL